MIVIVMGVSGCGKSTVGEGLAQRWGGEFLDADAYHPQANIDKMSRGIPLTDEDRAGWLDTLASLLRDRLASPKPTILACSALKEAYRRKLKVSPEVHFLYLKGTFELLDRRLHERKGHYMKAGLLESQLATLEEPSDALTLDIALPVETILDRAEAEWRPA